MFDNGTPWSQILLDGLILLTFALVALAWVASVVRVYRELRLQGLARLDLAFWLALVIILPLVGYVVYRFARQVEAFLLPAVQPAVPGRRPDTLLGAPAAAPDGQDAAGLTQPAGPVEGLRWRLLIVSGPEEGRSIELDGMPALIGRGREAGIRLDRDAAISRRHAELYAAGGGLRVRNLGSRHGTAVNESPVGDAPLRPGDRLRVGGTTLFLQVGRMN